MEEGEKDDKTCMMSRNRNRFAKKVWLIEQ